MERVLQIILLIGTTTFSLHILNKVRIKKLELKYTLVWLLACLAFFILALFPIIIERVSKWIAVKDDVNTLFLLILFFMLVIIFSLTCSISDNAKRVNTLIQEIGLLKLQIAEMMQYKLNESKKEVKKSE
jgi:hypothetical protein